MGLISFKSWLRATIIARIRGPLSAILGSEISSQMDFLSNKFSRHLRETEEIYAQRFDEQELALTSVIEQIALQKSELQTLSEIVGSAIEQIGLQHDMQESAIVSISEDLNQKLFATNLESSEHLTKLNIRLWEANQNFLSRLYMLEAKCLPRSKIRCAFMVADTTLWDVYAPIFALMSNSDDFEPIVIAFSRQDIQSDKDESQVRMFFEELNICPEVQGFDDRGFKPVNQFDLDLIFYTLGSKAYPDLYKIENTSLYCRTCYLSYGFLLVDEKEYQFNQPFHHAPWTVFASTQREIEYYDQMSPRSQKNTVLVGYPKFDLFQSLTQKSQERITVIWAPHWTIGQLYPVLNFGTFDQFYQLMFEYMKSTPEIDYIFKPHPNLRYAADRLNLSLGGGGYAAYMEELDALDNISVVVHGDYFDMFMNSAGMITDSVSFLAEYLPTTKPLLFLDRIDRAKMSDVGEEIISVHYNANTFEQIVEFIENTILAGRDHKKTLRAKAASKLLNIDDVSSSEKILAYLRSSFN